MAMKMKQKEKDFSTTSRKDIIERNNSDLGKALRGSSRSAISDGYDGGAKELRKNNYGKPISQYMRNKRGSNVDKLTGYTGLGLKMAGDGRMKKNPSWNYDRRMRPAVVRPDMEEIKKRMTKQERAENFGFWDL